MYLIKWLVSEYFCVRCDTLYRFGCVCVSVRQMKSPAVTEQCMLSEKLAWQKEKATLQAALRKTEAELSKVTASNENRPTNDLSNNRVSWIN